MPGQVQLKRRKIDLIVNSCAQWCKKAKCSLALSLDSQVNEIYRIVLSVLSYSIFDPSGDYQSTLRVGREFKSHSLSEKTPVATY